ncbi:MAG TPA: phosphoribosylaminoimidazolesuccinocarboxamide synthase [Candidatus Desulfofervidus auxilii]|uniref:Phosphoribosylaminoimidazole-succinocarboxamide synthase n=1 Tax=Desulfofervidus auxilii TaxID=1621989 RepID=A0A7C1ZFF9_DESA2|nr:phosphoribosylaminoimidazolesuccinocarboxamide synthase [Candidatus Desulfofervidus auxilii]HEC68490.1 phosphoribosylaminoimidazolesuccinocarboxamide synthase [Candidatus Desulfofervidus auxilii]
MIVFETNLPNLGPLHRGKVRDIYDLGKHLLIIATDRISAFDVVMPDAIPDKGYVLTQISLYWFKKKENIVPHHLVTAEVSEFPSVCQKYTSILDARSMLVKKTRPLPVECIVRGYLAGSAWKDYQKTGEICGYKLPPGMKEAEKLPEPLFTPSTKAKEGHDVNITFEQMVSILGNEKMAQEIKEYSLTIYKQAVDIAFKKGIIIADTKFEFGLDENDRLILIDELLTPDSSRFWPKEQYQPGHSQPSFDKQYLRDYLQNINWNKKPPAPKLPQEVIMKTREKYFEALHRLLG